MAKPSDSHLIPTFGFNHKEMNPDQNYGYWREAIKTMFDVDVLGRDDLPPFYADIVSYSLGSILFGFSRAAPQRFSRTVKTIARSGSDHILVQLYMSGGYQGVAGKMPIEVCAGDICVLDCAETLETLATDFENLTMVIPRGMLESKLAKPEALHGLVLKSTSALTQVLALHLVALFRLAPQMTTSECDNIAQGTIALIVACLQGEIDAREELVSGGPASLLLRVRRFIDDRLASSDLGPDFIAAQFGLSRASLYRLFEPLGGVSDYIRNKRLRRIFFELRSPDCRGQRMSEIARRWGFNNESTFTRAFKTAYGVPPATVRDAVQFEALDSDPSMSDERQTIARWMRDIIGDGATNPV